MELKLEQEKMCHVTTKHFQAKKKMMYFFTTLSSTTIKCLTKLQQLKHIGVGYYKKTRCYLL